MKKKTFREKLFKKLFKVDLKELEKNNLVQNSSLDELNDTYVFDFYYRT